MINLPAAFAGIATMSVQPFGALSLLAPSSCRHRRRLDDDGVFQPGSPATRVPCRVQVVEADEAMRESEGFADGDAILMILPMGWAST
jgi:hypothetical protein